MKKTENIRAANTETEIQAESLTVNQITSAWRICQDRINSTQREQDDLFVRDGDNIDALYDLEARRGKLKKRSEELVQLLINTQSQTPADIASKLSLWRDVNCPPETPFNRKTAIDFVVVSALSDLEKLAS